MDNSDLPPEVLKELRKTRSSPGNLTEMERRLVAIIAASRSEVSLDEVIIQMWRQHSTATRRKFVMGKLYRLSVAGHIDRVEGRKGYYRAPAPLKNCRP